VLPLPGADGQFTTLLIIAWDVTERKEAEEARRQQAVELQRANEELQQFAYIVSHDL
jgi:light-regulated signal transduction histidine kinase (bacteriophytochrome)